jgi:hypothetical protein
MLALIILYTISSLWILPQPIVEDDRVAIHVQVLAASRDGRTG